MINWKTLNFDISSEFQLNEWGSAGTYLQISDRTWLDKWFWSY